MYQANVSFLGEAMLDYAANGNLGGRIGNRDHLGAVQGCYQTMGDDRWVTVTAATDAEWQGLCGLLSPEAWSPDRPPATLAEARARHDDVDQALAAWAAGRTREAAVEQLRAIGLAAGPVNDNRDLLLDRHLRARGFFEMVEHAPHTAIGRRPIMSRPYKISDLDLSVERPAPPLGEANAYVFRGLLGLSQEAYQRLVDDKLTGELEPLAQPPEVMPMDEQVRRGRIRLYDRDYRQRLGLEPLASTAVPAPGPDAVTAASEAAT